MLSSLLPDKYSISVIKNIIVLFVLCCIKSTGFSNQKADEFEPNGKPIVLIFANFHNDFVSGGVLPAFDKTQSYLGYQYRFNAEW